MQLGNITVHSSLSRDCSDILVSGGLKATLVQAENAFAFEIPSLSRVGPTRPLFALLPQGI